jgi:hypothetical protein
MKRVSWTTRCLSSIAYERSAEKHKDVVSVGVLLLFQMYLFSCGLNPLKTKRVCFI